MTALQPQPISADPPNRANGGALALALYRGAWSALAPLAPSILRGRAKRGKEDTNRLGERLGEASLARPDGTLVWIHGASVEIGRAHV